MKYILFIITVTNVAFAQNSPFNDSYPPGYEKYTFQVQKSERNSIFKDLAEAKADNYRAKSNYIDLLTVEKMDSMRQYKGDISPELKLLGQSLLRDSYRKK